MSAAARSGSRSPSTTPPASPPRRPPPGRSSATSSRQLPLPRPVRPSRPRRTDRQPSRTTQPYDGYDGYGPRATSTGTAGDQLPTAAPRLPRGVPAARARRLAAAAAGATTAGSSSASASRSATRTPHRRSRRSAGPYGAPRRLRRRSRPQDYRPQPRTGRRYDQQRRTTSRRAPTTTSATPGAASCPTTGRLGPRTAAARRRPAHRRRPVRWPRSRRRRTGPGEPTARLNPKYLFDTFVIGASNRFAHAAAVAVAEAPAKAYNPLFIYGESGLGKTHLLHAIGHYARSLYPGTRVRYVSSEEFTNEFINSIRDGKGDSFRKRYRDMDILLVDDIQFLAEQGVDAGGVLPHLQHAPQRQQADRALLATGRPSSW